MVTPEILAGLIGALTVFLVELVRLIRESRLRRAGQKLTRQEDQAHGSGDAI